MSSYIAKSSEVLFLRLVFPNPSRFNPGIRTNIEICLGNGSRRGFTQLILFDLSNIGLPRNHNSLQPSILSVKNVHRFLLALQSLCETPNYFSFQQGHPLKSKLVHPLPLLMVLSFINVLLYYLDLIVLFASLLVVPEILTVSVLVVSMVYLGAQVIMKVAIHPELVLQRLISTLFATA